MARTGPALRNLQRVIPVAKTRANHGIIVTLLCVEVYEDGFATQLRFQSDGVSYIGDPAPSLRVTDNTGRDHIPALLSTMGRGSFTHWDWHVAFGFAPAIGADVEELRLAIQTVRCTRWDQTEGKPIATGQAGPWVFTVSVA